jgi:hypothetical protein
MQDDDLLSRKSAVNYLLHIGCPISSRVLEELVSTGGGPPFIKVRNARVWYKRRELRDWAKTQVVRVE